ncbi:MAG: PEGA domain-containing protein [Acidobacteria bacterium]|nr:PEGA domain-containing protein [Acidobacteriota bacterium]MBI3663342.1 PEGA domain-containing protein [Acidobacteriota bacterium]
MTGLRIAQTVSSADAQVGQTVDFDVLEEVKVGEILVIAKGGIAWATVTEAQPKRRMGRGGKLQMNIDSVRLMTGERAALRAVKGGQGGGHVGAMTGAIVAAGILFFPAAPFFLFMHGKDISIPKGTEITAYINGNIQLDAAKLQEKLIPPQVAPAANPTAAQASTDAQLEITSTPAGAEIEIDGTFVGNTPSTISVSPGDHVIMIKKSGYKLFEKKLKTTTGKVSITAALESETKP